MNIEDCVKEYAEHKRLELFETGGGCDYVGRTFGKQDDAPVVLIGSKKDIGRCPKTLREYACAVLYPRGLENHESCVIVKTDHMQGVMDWLTTAEISNPITTWPNRRWEDNTIQFPRLLAEIWMNVELLPTDIRALCDSMDLEEEYIVELFNRAQEEWEVIKEKSMHVNL